ncbi:hypothetical protein MHC_06006 [Mycoplasma haemocanis str. Illinois]|uniref:Uncharacterized protein n=1 Tax=Mycoplasma haemocanis (strain Illinois) TaxID=1111676 RepID=I6RDK3_MYCHN|nr:hypothetical protein MHC_06006 [Mycoplasma haemocanis str. Illinois]
MRPLLYQFYWDWEVDIDLVTLEWQGLKLIKDTERNHWQSVLYENKKVSATLSIDISNIEGIKG